MNTNEFLPFKITEGTNTSTPFIAVSDTFAFDRKINEIREGDYLVFYNAGAYGFEMSSNFNSRLKPAEVLIKDGKAQLIRRKEHLFLSYYKI